MSTSDITIENGAGGMIKVPPIQGWDLGYPCVSVRCALQRLTALRAHPSPGNFPPETVPHSHGRGSSLHHLPPLSRACEELGGSSVDDVPPLGPPRTPPRTGSLSAVPALGLAPGGACQRREARPPPQSPGLTQPIRTSRLSLEAPRLDSPPRPRGAGHADPSGS